MLTDKHEIGTGSLFCLAFAVIFGYGLPKIAFLGAQYIGPNGFWGIVTGFLLSIGVIFILESLAKRFPQHSMVDLGTVLFGRPAGIMIGAVYLLFFLALIIWEIRSLVDTYHVYFLIRTPIWVLTSALVLSSLYIVSKGVDGIARVASFLFILPLVLIILIILVSFKGFNPDNIKPLFYFEGSKLWSGAVQMFNPFLTLIPLYTVYRLVSNKRIGAKALISATGLAAGLLLLIVIETIGVLGTGEVSRLNWAFMELTKHADIPLLFQSSGLYFAGIYLIETIIGISLIYFVVIDDWSRLTSRKSRRWSFWFFAPLIIFAVIMLKSDTQALRFFDYLRIIGFILVVVLPAMIWLYAVLLRKKAV